jgi:hypothetical protein
LFCVLLRKTGCGGNVAVPPDNGGRLLAGFTYVIVVPLTEDSAKAPSYAFGLHAGGVHPGMATPAMTMVWPTGTFVKGELSATVTVLPVSLIAEMLDV